jgi:MFS family permease
MAAPYARATLVVGDEEGPVSKAVGIVTHSNFNGSGPSGVERELEMQPLQFQVQREDEYEQFHSLPSIEEIAAQTKKTTSWNDWFYPPDVPRECQLLRRENIAIPACYLLVGIMQGLSGPLINVYPLDLGATEAQQTTLSSIRSLPASFKLLFGFWSDNVPLFGYRRKSYMILGWLVCSLSLVMLMLGSNLERIPQEDSSSSSSSPPQGAPSIPFLSVSLLGFGIGFWLADVMGDSVVAEKAKLEITKGQLQSTCYACRFFGLMVAAPCSTGMYSQVGPYYVILLLAILPLTILVLIYNLTEARNAPVASTAEQCGEIWKTVCSRAVWQPMGFVSIYVSYTVYCL